MNIALCYESVLPCRGGCETYIAGLARRLAADGHEVHLYAWRWDESALPARLLYHQVPIPPVPRFLRPWFFGRACRRLLGAGGHDVSVGFDKIAELDVIYPQAGVYSASVGYNLLKHRQPWLRRLLRAAKWFDPAHLSFLALEREQYASKRTVHIAISRMVRAHMLTRHGLDPARVPVLPIATPPARWEATFREQRRQEARRRWGLAPGRVTALFVGMNYRLKGLEPLLRALARLRAAPLDLVVAGKSAAGGFVRQARRLGVADRVRFVGYCADMRDAYFAADFLVHPTFYDPCANVVPEALLCGLPVITSRHNGASDLLTLLGGRGVCAEGYVVDDPHDDEWLAWCLARLLQPGIRETCAEAARRRAAGWTFEHHYRRLLEILTGAAQVRQAA